MNKKNTLNYPKSAAMGFFLGTEERVRNNRGKRAISVRAIEVLLYNDIVQITIPHHIYHMTNKLNIFVVWSSEL